MNYFEEVTAAAVLSGFDYAYSFLVVIFYVLALALVSFRLYMNKKRMTTYPCVEGKILFVEEVKKFKRNKGFPNFVDDAYTKRDAGISANYLSGDGFTTVRFFKIVYMYNDFKGEQHIGKCRVRRGFAGMFEGQPLRIYFSPDNPSLSYVEKVMEQEKSIFTAAIAVSAVAALFALPTIIRMIFAM